MELTEQRLTALMRQNGDIMMKGVEKLHEARSQESVKELDDQSNAFKAFSKNMESVSKNMFGKQSRENSISSSKQLAMMKKNIEASEKLSIDEQKTLKGMIGELTEVNKSLLDNEHSLKSAMTGAFKESLPSITGVLGAVGLDSPMILFMGTFLQGIMDKRKEQAKAQQDLIEENQLENITQEIEQSEELAEQTAQLGYIGDLMESMLQSSQGQAFEEIEKQRESIRAQENLIEAIEGIEGGDEAKKKDPFNISGIMETIGGISMLLTSLGAGIVAAMAFIAPWVAAIAAGYALFEGFKGSIDGWNNAAEKLGKESATTSDKIASAIGGFYGGVFGIADKITGLFGFKTDIGGWVDEAVTKNLAAAFDFIKGIAANIKRVFTETKDYIKSTFENLIATGKQIIDDFKTSVLANFNLLKEKLFAFEMPDMPTIKDMAGDAIQTIIAVIGDIIKSIAASLMELDPVEMVKNLITPEVEKIESTDIKKGDVYKTLSGEGAVKADFRGQAKIVDPERIGELSNEQLQELIGSNAFKGEDLAMIQSNKSPTVAEITGNQPRALEKDQDAQSMIKGDIEKEKAASNAVGGVAMNAPNNSQTNNSSNTTNMTTSQIDTRESDWSIRAIREKFFGF